MVIEENFTLKSHKILSTKSRCSVHHLVRSVYLGNLPGHYTLTCEYSCIIVFNPAPLHLKNSGRASSLALSSSEISICEHVHTYTHQYWGLEKEGPRFNHTCCSLLLFHAGVSWPTHHPMKLWYQRSQSCLLPCEISMWEAAVQFFALQDQHVDHTRSALNKRCMVKK